MSDTIPFDVLKNLRPFLMVILKGKEYVDQYAVNLMGESFDDRYEELIEWVSDYALTNIKWRDYAPVEMDVESDDFHDFVMSNVGELFNEVHIYMEEKFEKLAQNFYLSNCSKGPELSKISDLHVKAINVKSARDKRDEELRAKYNTVTA